MGRNVFVSLPCTLEHHASHFVLTKQPVQGEAFPFPLFHSTPMQAHEAVMKLRDNLRAEQHVVLEFAIAVFRGVVRPRQMVRG